MNKQNDNAYYKTIYGKPDQLSFLHQIQHPATSYISGNKTPETVEAVAVAQVPAIAHGSSKAVFSRYEDITKVLKLLSATRLVSFRYVNHKIMVVPYQRF